MIKYDYSIRRGSIGCNKIKTYQRCIIKTLNNLRYYNFS